MGLTTLTNRGMVSIGAMSGVYAGGAAYDSDAQAFFTAASITDSTFKNAYNAWVKSAKEKGYYSVFTAIYPVPLNASQNIVNAKNPGTFNLTLFGGWTHDASGATPNGSTGYARTGLVPSDVFPSKDSRHYSLYSGTNRAGASRVEMGCAGSGLYDIVQIRHTSDIFYYATSTNAGSAQETGMTDSSGLHIANRLTSTTSIGFKNGNKYTYAETANGLPTSEIQISGYNNGGTPALLSDIKYQFITAGTGMTDTQAGDYRTDLLVFLAAIGR